MKLIYTIYGFWHFFLSCRYCFISCMLRTISNSHNQEDSERDKQRGNGRRVEKLSQGLHLCFNLHILLLLHLFQNSQRFCSSPFSSSHLHHLSFHPSLLFIPPLLCHRSFFPYMASKFQAPSLRFWSRTSKPTSFKFLPFPLLHLFPNQNQTKPFFKPNLQQT